MSERLGRIFEHELGDRPNGLRPASSGEHRLRKSPLKHAQQGSADHKRQQNRHHQQFHRLEGMNEQWATEFELNLAQISGVPPNSTLTISGGGRTSELGWLCENTVYVTYIEQRPRVIRLLIESLHEPAL